MAAVTVASDRRRNLRRADDAFRDTVYFGMRACCMNAP
jgi:hypothetical protein